ncbi:MAG: alpha/beta hydrolase [Planctomycetota bacterium]
MKPWALACLFVLAAFTPEGSKSWDVAVATKDGKSLRCRFLQPVGEAPVMDARAVILVHDFGGRPENWGELPSLLADEGFAVLVLELRGHGDTPVGKEHWTRFEKAEVASMTADIEAGRVWLQQQKKVHVRKVAVVAARVSSILALKAMKDDKDLLAAYLLSPGLSYRGVEVDSALEGIAPRPVFMTAAAEDKKSCESMKSFESAGAKSRVLDAEESPDDFGTALLKSRPALLAEITGWLKDNF